MTTVLASVGTTVLFVRRFLADYARNPVNPLVLVLVPVVFVVVAAGSMADAARLLGGSGADVPTATAGWAAGFLAGVAMYFQTRSSRAADRRLVLAGLPSNRLVAARVATGLALAGLVTTAALVALAVRTGVDAGCRPTSSPSGWSTCRRATAAGQVISAGPCYGRSAHSPLPGPWSPRPPASRTARSAAALRAHAGTSS